MLKGRNKTTITFKSCLTRQKGFYVLPKVSINYSIGRTHSWSFEVFQKEGYTQGEVRSATKMQVYKECLAAMDTTRLTCLYPAHVTAALKPPSLLLAYYCAEQPVGSRLAHARNIAIVPSCVG